MTQVHVLTQSDSTEIPISLNEIRVVAVVRNEMTRIPQFLKYHRDLGVDRFFFINNDSSDGTAEYLAAQPDCHVFHTSNKYSESKYGVDWTNHILNLYGTGQWCLVLDADELLVYPSCETIGLKDLCAYLDGRGSQGLFTFMLDMYPKGSLVDAVATPEKSFFDVAPYFDKDYTFVERIHLKKQKPFPPQEIVGGPRARCFYGPQGEKSYARRLYMHLHSRIPVLLRKFGVKMRVSTIKAPALFKIPLVKWKKGYEYTSSTHILSPDIKLSTMTGIIAHFKFFSDFHDRVVDAISTGQHTEGSAEYKQYMKRMTELENGAFFYEGSTKFTSSQDLVKLNLMKRPESFKKQAA